MTIATAPMPSPKMGPYPSTPQVANALTAHTAAANSGTKMMTGHMTAATITDCSRPRKAIGGHRTGAAYG